MDVDEVCDGTGRHAYPEDDGKGDCPCCGRRVGFNPRSRPDPTGRRALARHGHQGRGLGDA